jgi:hypothetical protein
MGNGSALKPRELRLDSRAIVHNETRFAELSTVRFFGLDDGCTIDLSVSKVTARP